MSIWHYLYDKCDSQEQNCMIMSEYNLTVLMSYKYLGLLYNIRMQGKEPTLYIVGIGY